MSPIRAVLFDAVGTLIYPDPPVAEAYHAIGRRFGSRRSVAEIAARFPAAFAQSEAALKPTNQAAERRRWQAVVAAVFDDLADPAGEPFDALWDHFSHAQHWRLFDDVAATWRDLAATGLLVGIASNFDDRLAGVCRDLPPLDGCRHLYWSARVGWSKPAVEFFRHIEREFDLAPSEILLVGDDYRNDYLGATAAGWQAVLVQRDGNSPARANAIGRLHELADWMASPARGAEIARPE